MTKAIQHLVHLRGACRRIFQNEEASKTLPKVINGSISEIALKKKNISQLPV